MPSKDKAGCHWLEGLDKERGNEIEPFCNNFQDALPFLERGRQLAMSQKNRGQKLMCLSIFRLHNESTAQLR